MIFTLMLIRDPGGVDPNEYGARVWDAEAVADVEGMQRWSAPERAVLLRALRDADRRLPSQTEPDDADDDVYLWTDAKPSVLYELDLYSLRVDIDVPPGDAVAAAKLLGPTLDALDRIAHAHRLLVWVPELERTVNLDLRRERTTLEQAYHKARDVEQNRITEQRTGEIVMIVGLALMTGLIVVQLVLYL